MNKEKSVSLETLERFSMYLNDYEVTEHASVGEVTLDALFKNIKNYEKVDIIKQPLPDFSGYFYIIRTWRKKEYKDENTN